MRAPTTIAAAPIPPEETVAPPASKDVVDEGSLYISAVVTDEDGNRIIMAARAHWFAEEDASADGNQ